MRLFLIVFFLIYGTLHLYVFLKAKAALNLGLKGGIPLIIFMAVMTSTPVIIRYLESYELEYAARVMSYTGYIWMGVLLLFFAFAMCIDLYRLSLYLFNLVVNADVSVISVSIKGAFFIPLIAAMAAGCYGFFEARHIRVEHLTVKSHRVPAESSGLKIVQISDVHIGLIVREERLRRIAEKVKAESPDILVSTGDFVDGQINRLNGLAEIILQIKPVYGKYAITGNHEYYAGLDQALEFTRRAGFTMLRGQAVEAGGIYIAGVDDSTGQQFGSFNGSSEKDLLSALDRDKFRILLKHRPVVSNDGFGLFDLQLSGHTHKGQIFPFNLVTKLYYPHHAGLLEFQNGARLYVSRGSGTWGPPIRFLSPPEITVINLERAD